MTLSSFLDLLKSLNIQKPEKPMSGLPYLSPPKKPLLKGWTIHCEPSGHLEVWRK